ncbi:AAA family ATPase [Rhodoferax sp.]|uniref:AAA family ATPase n=1 Tax=Rhodoferax sp. TaxID=50421 RepID=UPI0026072AF9|nr:AAA family ATPase [Rhodoferax sp.]MDD2924454.1 BTAD domain-containing putative transcriptional regulator [Rhodoferax sp.]
MTAWSSPGPDFQWFFLGGFEARLNGHPVTGLSYQKMRALLAYLVMGREQHHKREVLAGLLWCGSDATTARGNLRRTLTDLRQALERPCGAAVLSASKVSLQFIAKGSVDVMDFVADAPHAPDSVLAIEHEERILALYRGQFLAGMSLPDCPGFQDWLQKQRAALHRRALFLLEKLSSWYEQRGRYRQALPFALRYAELEPCDETAQRRAMRLYTLSGQSGAALRQYELCSSQLKSLLGAQPEERTRQLAEQIRGGTLLTMPPGTVWEEGWSIGEPLLPQRRQVTVLCCELGLAGVEDLEEMVAALGPRQARCVDILRQFSGHVVQTHGGGLLAYFGFPCAREDAARQAVQAALAVVDEVCCGVDLRVGIHTGLVVTGGSSVMPDTSGQTTKVAMGLCQQAAPREVLISRATHHIVAGYFDCAAADEPLPCDGGEAVRVFGRSGAQHRLDAAAQLTPLIGREAEMAQLLSWWRQGMRGERQVVMLQAEAGMGKSRLLHALKARLAGSAFALCEWRCFPEYAQSPFHPLLVMLEGTLGFATGDTPKAKFDKLQASLARHDWTPGLDMVGLLAQWFSLPLAPSAAPVLAAPQQQEQILAVLLALLSSLTTRQATLLVVEDLHWIDPSTLELLTRLIRQTAKSPVLVVLTARPEFIAPWPPALMKALDLRPLTKNEVTSMVAAIRADMMPEAVHGIVERADGVPLYVEEMTKIAASGNPAGIPATLQDLLAARMDMLGSARHAAQLAATLGREFDLALLRKIHPSSAGELVTQLDALRDAGLILNVSDTTGQFKHALIQEAAYQSQSTPDRQAAHRRIAQVLQSDFQEFIAQQPELLAQHLSAAGEICPAMDCWMTAARHAAQRSSNQEAIGHLHAALKLVEALPTGLNRDQSEFRILVNLCPVLYSAKGYGSLEASQANARISVLCDQVGDSPELFQARWALVINTLTVVGSHKREVLKSARQLLGMAHGDPLRLQAAHYVVANAAYWLGDFETTCTHARQALALYQPEHSQELLARFNQDQSGPMAYMSWALYLLGFADQALAVCDRMLNQARACSDRPQTLASAMSFALALYRWMGLSAQALSLSAETISLARQHGLSVWLTVGEMSHGWAMVMHGQHDEGIAELQSSVSRMRQAMGGISVAFLVPLVEAYVHLRRYEEAHCLLVQTQADAQRCGDGHFTAELYRLQGVCLLGLSTASVAQAEACFAQALAVSRRQQARSLELRAAISLARLWQSQGQSAQARHLLEEVCRWFAQGRDTRDFQAALELLRVLNGALVPA